MYWQILKSSSSIQNKAKSLAVYGRLRRGTRIAWAKRFKQVFSRNPQFRKKLPEEIIREHVSFWAGFRRHVNLCDLKISVNGSEQHDPRIVPEEIFVADIEPSLNGRKDLSLLANKSLYYKLYEVTLFPTGFLNLIDGRAFGGDLCPLNQESLERNLKSLPYPVLSKPSTGTAGGVGVSISNDSEQLKSQMSRYPDLIVQEIIEQDEFFHQFNPHGLNTLRVNLYRSVKDDAIKFLNCALRMGVGGSLDNETDGGIVCHIDADGFLTGTARDKYGVQFDRHPDTHLKFEAQIPRFQGMKEVALTLSEQIPYGRLFSLDMCLDRHGNWRVIEINMHGQTIRFAQYAGDAFFGPYTEEVVDHCLSHHWAIDLSRR